MKTALPDLATQQAYYDARWATGQHAHLLDLDRAIVVLQTLRALNLKTPRILDLGCGRGWLTTVWARFGPTLGIELSPVAVDLAAARFPDVSFRSGDVFTIDLPAEAFDVVVSVEVLEHVEDQAGYLARAAHCLRPGGVLILTTPNASNPAIKTLEAEQLQPVEQMLTVRQLRNLLRQRGFVIQTLRTFILGAGNTGLFRIANSPKLRRVVHRVGIGPMYTHILERTGFGLHTFAVARKPAAE